MTEPRRFYDVETGGPIELQLRQNGAEFHVLRQFGYRDPGYGDAFVVPAEVETFTTDLASIPRPFMWLVPGLGTHLPAVVLHDGLVVAPGGEPTHLGPRIDREEADRILRDAMASLATPRIRRWLMWSGVALATAWSTLTPRWWWRSLVTATITIVAVLGVAATLDIIDVWDGLPWMADRPWWAELGGGVVLAVLIPLLVSIAWGRRWPAGAILGVALALLLHVTVVLLALLGVYWMAEWLVSRSEGTGPDVSDHLDRATGDRSGPREAAEASP
ncbi:MAG: DUF1353 domain-containing protein [Acidimicrobiales bacterium]